jgi:ribosome maturation factor RimP
VTSPGVDRPLTEHRHWRRNVGRLVTVAVSGDEVTGRVSDVDEAGVVLAVEAKGKPGAKKKPPTPRHVPWTQLGSGRVQVEFGRPEAGDESADTDPADEAIPSGGGQ